MNWIAIVVLPDPVGPAMSVALPAGIPPPNIESSPGTPEAIRFVFRLYDVAALGLTRRG